jgi:cold-inducible RNA-binding protein
MAKRLYVGGLPYSTTQDELKDLFSQAGTVGEATIVIDKFSGRSKGFGFVEFANDAEADKAIETLNGSQLGGRSIVVNEARPMTERRPRREFGGGGNGGGYGGGGGGYGRGDR